MSGSVWILSYVVLCVGVLAALATSLAVARQIGRVAVGENIDPLADWAKGPVPGSPAPPLDLLTVGGGRVRPQDWQAGLLLQVVVASDEDVASLREFASRLPIEFVDGATISAIGPGDLLARVAEETTLEVFVDTFHQVSAALRTPVRPFAMVVRDGQVAAAGSFETVEELMAMMEAIGDNGLRMRDAVQLDSLKVFAREHIR